MTQVFISIGSNIDKENNIRAGLKALQQHYGPLLGSRVYESAAVGFDGDNFYNLVVAFDSNDSVEAIDQQLHAIEQQCGRKRSDRRFMARTLDLDLLLYGDLVRHDDDFDIPRDEITRYAFVLLPLSEISGTTLHPEKNIDFQTLWQKSELQDQKLWPVDFTFEMPEE